MESLKASSLVNWVTVNRTVFVDERSGRASCVNVMRECAQSVALLLSIRFYPRTFTSLAPGPK